MIPFGKKIRVRNFWLLKYTKTLKPSELKELRNQKGIPQEVQRSLKRGGLPYIKVSTLAEDWSCEFVIASTMYRYIETKRMREEAGFENCLEDESLNSLHNLFVLMYADCSVLGDQEYMEAKAVALKAFMERSRASKTETAKEKAKDDKILEEVKQEEEAKAQIVEMAAEAEKGGEDGKE